MNEGALLERIKWIVNDSNRSTAETLGMLGTVLNFHRTALVVGQKEARAMDPQVNKVLQKLRRHKR